MTENRTTLTAAAVIEGGTVYPATYHLAETHKSGYILIQASPVDVLKIVISSYQHGAIWDAFTAAARGESVEVDAELFAALIEAAAPVKARKPRQERKAAAAVKPWDGMQLCGKAYKITFDAAEQKTILTFKRYPGRAAVEEVKAAGFTWNPAAEQWRRGYKKSSFDAATALHERLAVMVG